MMMMEGVNRGNGDLARGTEGAVEFEVQCG